jgi:hypothetical protein
MKTAPSGNPGRLGTRLASQEFLGILIAFDRWLGYSHYQPYLTASPPREQR